MAEENERNERNERLYTLISELSARRLWSSGSCDMDTINPEDFPELWVDRRSLIVLGRLGMAVECMRCRSGASKRRSHSQEPGRQGAVLDALGS